MKKRISLALAIVMVAAIMLSALPIATFADEAAPKNVCRIGAIEFDDFAFALQIAAMEEKDVIITLIDDVQFSAQTRIASNKKEDGTPYKLTIDGNGHTISSSSPNLFAVGSGAGAKEDIVFKDFNIEFSGTVGAVFHFYAGGNVLLEDVNINCVTPVRWTVFNANFQNTAENPLNVVMNNVDIAQPAYATTGDGNFIRAGNGDASTSPYINYYINDCDWVVTPSESTADATSPTKGIYVTHANAKYVLNNTVIISKFHPIYATSGLNKLDFPDGKPVLVEAINCKLGTLDPIGTEISGKKVDIVYTPGYEKIEGEYVAPVGEALYIEEGAAAVDCATLADALAKAAAATKNCTIKLAKDLTLTEAFQIKTLNKDVVVTFDGNDKTLTLSAGNAIKVGEAGIESKINLKNFDVVYSGGAGSIIQVYANGEVNISDVKINNTAKLNWCAVNALNNADTTLTMTIDDCVFVSEAEGNNANVGVVRTGNNGNIVNLTITNSDIAAVGEGGAKPAAALNVTTTKATIVIKDSALRATNNSAILFSQEVTTKAQITGTLLTITSETVKTISNEALVEAVDCVVEGGPVVVETTPEDTPEDTPEVTTPEVTTPEVTTPEVTTPEVTDAPADAPAGGCGGITVAAQLVALICAAAAIVIIKKK